MQTLRVSLRLAERPTSHPIVFHTVRRPEWHALVLYTSNAIELVNSKLLHVADRDAVTLDRNELRSGNFAVFQITH